jgi:hypothetical protein
MMRAIGGNTVESFQLPRLACKVVGRGSKGPPADSSGRHLDFGPPLGKTFRKSST